MNARCRQCGIFFVAHPRNAVQRHKMRCPFGCREAHRRAEAIGRSVACRCPAQSALAQAPVGACQPNLLRLRRRPHRRRHGRRDDRSASCYQTSPSCRSRLERPPQGQPLAEPPPAFSLFYAACSTTWKEEAAAPASRQRVSLSQQSPVNLSQRHREGVLATAEAIVRERVRV